MATVTLRVKNWPSSLNRYRLYYVVALFSGGWIWDTYNVKEGYIGLPPTMGPFVFDYDKMREAYDNNLTTVYGEFATSNFMLAMSSPISSYLLSPYFIPQPDQTYVWDLATDLFEITLNPTVMITNRSYKVSRNDRIYGDVAETPKGYVAASDAMLISQYLGNLRGFNADQIRAADINGDGIVSSVDAMQISQWKANRLDPSLSEQARIAYERLTKRISSKTGLPSPTVPAALTFKLSYFIGGVKVLPDDKETAEFAAGQSLSFEYLQNIQVATLGQYGSFEVIVLDPSGKQIVSGTKTFTT